MRRATMETRASSGALSTLSTRTPASSAKAISSSVFPTPEKTTLRASPPARSTRYSSPPDTMSNPEPSRANRLSTARFEFAFTA
jgi:hypothetical protein